MKRNAFQLSTIIRTVWRSRRLAWAAVLLIAGCSGPADDELTDLTGFATDYAAAWSGGDPQAFANFYASDGTFRINDGAPSVGRAAIAETAASFMESFPDMTVRLVRLERAGERINFHWRWTGTNTGPGGTGKAVDMVGYEQWTLDESGLILYSQGHLDQAEYDRQMGIAE